MQNHEVPQLSDWHAEGLYACMKPNGEIVGSTLSTTAYSARAEAVNYEGLIWGRLHNTGYRIVQLQITGVMPHKEKK